MHPHQHPNTPAARDLVRMAKKGPGEGGGGSAPSLSPLMQSAGVHPPVPVNEVPLRNLADPHPHMSTPTPALPTVSVQVPVAVPVSVGVSSFDASSMVLPDPPSYVGDPRDGHMGMGMGATTSQSSSSYPPPPVSGQQYKVMTPSPKRDFGTPRSTPKIKKELFRTVSVPGRVNEGILEECRTVSGALTAIAFPEEYAERVVEFMNENRIAHTKSMEDRELERSQRTPYKYQKKSMDDSMGDSGDDRIPKSHSGLDPPVMQVPKEDEKAEAAAATVGLKRGRSSDPLYHHAFEVEEMKKFFAIVLFSGEVRVNDLKKYWRRDVNEPMYGFVRNTMSRERFFQYYHSFRFTDQQLEVLSQLMDAARKKAWISTEQGVSVEENEHFSGCSTNEFRVKVLGGSDPSYDPDQAALENYSQNRKSHWSQARITWEMTVNCIVNAHRLYQYATGKKDISRNEWQKLVRYALGGLRPDEEDPHPKSMPVPGCKMARCCCCRALHRKQSRTPMRCERCGPVCYKCEQSGDHLKYVELPANMKKIRRSYTVGRK